MTVEEQVFTRDSIEETLAKNTITLSFPFKEKTNRYKERIANVLKIDKHEAIELYYEIENDINVWLSIPQNQKDKDPSCTKDFEANLTSAKQAAFRLLGLLLHHSILNPPSSPTAGAVLNTKLVESMKTCLDRCLKFIVSILGCSNNEPNYCKVSCISSLWVLGCQKWPISLWNAVSSKQQGVSNGLEILHSIAFVVQSNTSVAVQTQALVVLTKLSDTIPHLMKKHVTSWLPQIFPLAVLGKAGIVREKSLALFKRMAAALVCNSETFIEGVPSSLADTLFQIYSSSICSEVANLDCFSNAENHIISFVSHLFLLLPLQKPSSIRSSAVNGILGIFEKALLHTSNDVALYALEHWKFVCLSSIVFPSKSLKVLAAPIVNAMHNSVKSDPFSRSSLRTFSLNLWKCILIIHENYIFGRKNGSGGEGMEVLFKPVYGLLEIEEKSAILSDLFQASRGAIDHDLSHLRSFLLERKLDQDVIDLKLYLPPFVRIEQIHFLIENTNTNTNTNSCSLMQIIFHESDDKHSGENDIRCNITDNVIISERGFAVWNGLLSIVAFLRKRDVNPTLPWNKFMSLLVKLISSVLDWNIDEGSLFKSVSEKRLCIYHFLIEQFIENLPSFANMSLVDNLGESGNCVGAFSPILLFLNAWVNYVSIGDDFGAAFKSDHEHFFQKMLNLLKRGTDMLENMRIVLKIISNCQERFDIYWQKACFELRLFLEETRILSEDLETTKSPCHPIYEDFLVFPLLKMKNGLEPWSNVFLVTWNSLFETYFNVCLMQKEQPLNVLDSLLSKLMKSICDSTLQDEFSNRWLGPLLNAMFGAITSVAQKEGFEFQQHFSNNTTLNLFNSMYALTANYVALAKDGQESMYELARHLEFLLEKNGKSPKGITKMLFSIFEPKVLDQLAHSHRNPAPVMGNFLKMTFLKLSELTGENAKRLHKNYLNFEDESLRSQFIPIIKHVLTKSHGYLDECRNCVFLFWQAVFGCENYPIPLNDPELSRILSEHREQPSVVINEEKTKPIETEQGTPLNRKSCNIVTPSYSSPPPSSILKRRMFHNSALMNHNGQGGNMFSPLASASGGKRKVRFYSSSENGDVDVEEDGGSFSILDNPGKMGSPCPASRKKPKYEKEKYLIANSDDDTSNSSLPLPVVKDGDLPGSPVASSTTMVNSQNNTEDALVVKDPITSFLLCLGDVIDLNEDFSESVKSACKGLSNETLCGISQRLSMILGTVTRELVDRHNSS